MGYTNLSETNPVAKHSYDCIWCPEIISKGTRHVHEVSIYDGEFQDHRWHSECYDAALTYFRETKESEFMPHECKRGTNEVI